MRRFWEFRGTPREFDTASRREEACLLNLCNVVAQCDMLLCTDVLGPSRIAEKTILILVHSALCTRFVSSSTLAELQERVEVPLQFGIPIQQVAQQAMNENGQKIFEVCWQEEE